jgi:hypothetical protein
MSTNATGGQPVTPWTLNQEPQRHDRSCRQGCQRASIFRVWPCPSWTLSRTYPRAAWARSCSASYRVLGCWHGPRRFLDELVILVGSILGPYVLLPRSSAVEVAAAPPPVRLGPELALQLHQAPDPGAIGTDVWLDVGGQLADGGQVDAEQLRAPLQRRCDRPAQVQVVPGPHRSRLSNRCSSGDRQRCVVRQDSPERGWAALGPQLGGTWGTAEDSRGQRTSRSAAVPSDRPGR